MRHALHRCGPASAHYSQPDNLLGLFQGFVSSMSSILLRAVQDENTWVQALRQVEPVV